MGLTEPPVRIRSAEDLFAVLSTGSLGQRVAVLKDIQQDPKRAVALGSHLGEDFVDFLIRMIPKSTGVLKKLQTLCLMSYDDPRTTSFLKEEFSRCKDAATVLHLGERLTLNVGESFFRPFLWSEKSAQALASCRICCSLPDLEPAEQLRIAILLDHTFEPPPIRKETLGPWMEELTGKHRLRTRELIEARGTESMLLWTRWDKLAEEEQEWLLSLSERLDPALTKQCLATLLATDVRSCAMVSAARRMEVELPPTILSSENPHVRAIAIAEGMADDSLEPFLAETCPLPVVLAVVGRCDNERLLTLLQDDRWQVRSAALRALSPMVDNRPLQTVRKLTLSSAVGTRAVAVELLLAWGDEAWLETNLLG